MAKPKKIKVEKRDKDIIFEISGSKFTMEQADFLDLMSLHHRLSPPMTKADLTRKEDLESKYPGWLSVDFISKFLAAWDVWGEISAVSKALNVTDVDKLKAWFGDLHARTTRNEVIGQNIRMHKTLRVKYTKEFEAERDKALSKQRKAAEKERTKNWHKLNVKDVAQQMYKGKSLSKIGSELHAANINQWYAENKEAVYKQLDKLRDSGPVIIG